MPEDPWAKRLGTAYEDWAIHELSRVGERNFDFSKHLFTVSAASFAVFSYIHQGFSFKNYFLTVGLSILALSVLIAVFIAEPPDFELDGSENLAERHSSYSRNGKALRRSWLTAWVLGIALIVLAPENRSAPSDVKTDSEDQKQDR